MAAQPHHQPLKDWSALATARHSFTTEQLQQFNAARVDPYLIQIAQFIGSQFNIALQGQRNLANAFASLPQAEFYSRRMGVGFSDRHIARILADSDGGFVFLGILGCLGEYFAEDVVVGIVMHLVSSRIDLPEGFEPSDFQWKHLVHLCQGVLATSPFATLITGNKETPGTAADHVNVAQIVAGLVSMSTLVGGGADKSLLEHTGLDAFWFAAVAEYLFDLRVIVQDSTGAVLLVGPGVDATNSQLTVQSGQMMFSEESIDLWPLSKVYPDTTTVTGGRVTWEKLFRSCFGRAFTDIDSLMVADFTGGAASLLSSTLQYDQTNPQVFFLPHASTIRGLSGYGLVETVTSWFPELRRLAPQMGKASRLPFQQARDRLDEISDVLDSSCMCNACGNAPATSTAICKHSIVEVIMALGMFIARTVVIPNLFPKRSGVLAFYERLHAGRQLYKGKQAPAPEGFMKDLSAALPTPRHMIETMCMLFTGSVPKEVKDTTLSISHEGISVSLNAWNPNSGVRDPENEQLLIRQRAGVSVSTGSSHIHGRIFNHGYWVPAFANGAGGGQSEPLSFSESFELLRTRPREVKQIVKPKNGDLMVSYIRVGKEEEERATALGWLVL